MSLAVATSPDTPRYRLDHTDRIQIGLNYFVCARSTHDAHLLQRVDDPSLFEFFTHAQVQALFKSSGFRHDPSYFSAEAQLAMAHAGVQPLHSLPEQDVYEMLRRKEYVRRFQEHERLSRPKGQPKKASTVYPKRVTRGDASMNRIAQVLNEEIREYDCQAALSAVRDKRSVKATTNSISGRTLGDGWRPSAWRSVRLRGSVATKTIPRTKHEKREAGYIA